MIPFAVEARTYLDGVEKGFMLGFMLGWFGALLVWLLFSARGRGED